MLRKDTNAHFEQSGVWIFARFRFVSGGIEAEKRLSRARHARQQREQLETPLLVAEDTGRKRRWWFFQDNFYWEDDGYGATEVKALVLERLQQRDRRVQRAVALMERVDLPTSPARASIPQAVRLAVFQRDGGRCATCGSVQHLQFDHIIPVALGGASTEANLQVLCEECNRAKGALI
jgi:hypothetical protein